MEKIIRHPEFGEITVTKSSGSRNIRLTVHPVRGVRVSIPWLTPVSAAERFVREKEEWIRESIAKQRERADRVRLDLKDGSKLNTVKREVSFIADGSCEERKIRVRVYDKVAEIIFHGGAEDPKIQQALKDAFVKYLRHEAAEVLPLRAAELAKRYGFSYNKVFLKNNTTNWGSCSRLNNINLNIHLVRLTPELCDFVILHELCHLVHRNHGPQFHELLNRLSNGRERELNRQLRRHSTRI